MLQKKVDFKVVQNSYFRVWLPSVMHQIFMIISRGIVDIESILHVFALSQIKPTVIQKK